MKPLAAALTDPAARNVAIRLTVASTLAMAAATALSLPNPWWAAMTVWMVGQPPRGLLFERSLAQLLGSFLGAAAGVALVLPWPGVPAASLFGLAVWIALCCGIANVMRHQRAYGAALCGLTSAVIVSLTLGTHVDPVGFAAARAMDSVLGIGSAILVAASLSPPSSGSTVASRARTVTSQALVLIAEALTEPGTRSLAREREFLLSLASLEASAEDEAAGSITARRKLKELHALFAFLLDLLVVARAIRSREGSALAPGHADMAVLREAFERAAGSLDAGDLDVQGIIEASQRIEKADPVLSPVLEEMRTLLLRAAAGYGQVMAAAIQPAPRWSIPHPDVAALRLAVLRGALAVSLVGLAWLSIGWDPLRYLVLGAGIFTVLFSAVDEPVPAVRKILIGGLGAAVAAFLWRIVMLPELANGWLSLALAVPLVFGASLLQARQATVFVGLAFNMLFAVLARPVDTVPSSPIGLAGIEVMLLSGIAVSYAFYRWLLPMNTQRRRMHLRASIRREVAAISIRAGTSWAARHLARLRYLVLSLAVRSRGRVHEAEDALAALSLGHALFRLGEMESVMPLPNADRRIIRETLRLTASPLDDPLRTGQKLRSLAARISPIDEAGVTSAAQASRMCWLLELAANDLTTHPSIFVSPQAGANR
ncbi:FUSC family protein [Roseomonas sp. E05]|uniref:FUSC family protein n=1 Tax=Roseomonas sp. E05 TaxID=3046310 RepID=UPI0024BB8986|nr:FUSC family protein [Roseomonas sp. E05]MDJ0391293.1 FUSC family protein [Roseomonas sp. E05]